MHLSCCTVEVFLLSHLHEQSRAQIHRRSYDNLKTIFGLATILQQLANSQNIYNNLKTYLKTKYYDHLLYVFRAGPKLTDRPIVLRFILIYVIRSSYDHLNFCIKMLVCQISVSILRRYLWIWAQKSTTSKNLIMVSALSKQTRLDKGQPVHNILRESNNSNNSLL